jgi:hypothetical protein
MTLNMHEENGDGDFWLAGVKAERGGTGLIKYLGNLQWGALLLAIHVS